MEAGEQAESGLFAFHYLRRSLQKVTAVTTGLEIVSRL
jgi:hypothetical protein